MGTLLNTLLNRRRGLNLYRGFESPLSARIVINSDTAHSAEQCECSGQ